MERWNKIGPSCFTLSKNWHLRRRHSCSATFIIKKYKYSTETKVAQLLSISYLLCRLCLCSSLHLKIKEVRGINLFLSKGCFCLGYFFSSKRSLRILHLHAKTIKCWAYKKKKAKMSCQKYITVTAGIKPEIKNVMKNT